MMLLRFLFFTVFFLMVTQTNAQILGVVKEGSGGFIKAIQFKVDSEVDLPRLKDLLGFEEGEAFHSLKLEEGLSRIADSERFSALSAEYNDETGVLTVVLESVSILSSVEVVLENEEGKRTEVPQIEEDIQSLVRYSKGDPVHADDLLMLQDRLRQRLVDRGYKRAKVFAALESSNNSIEKQLLITVALGKRVEISEIQFKGFTNSDSMELLSEIRRQAGQNEFQELVDILQDRISSLGGTRKLKMSSNVPLDWIWLNQVVEAWSKKQRELGYFDFKLNAKHVGGDPNATVEMELSRGPYYHLQISGAKEFWRHEIRSVLLEKTLRLGLPINLVEAKVRITEQYIKKGYRDIRVDLQVKGDDKRKEITAVIQEGLQYFVGPVEIEGVTDEQKPFVNKMIQRWRQLMSPTFERFYFDESRIKKSFSQLLSLLQEEGYSQARIVEFQPIFQKDSAIVKLRIALQIGFLSRIGEVSVIGNLLMDPGDLNEAVLLKIGEPFSQSRMEQSIRSINRVYQDLGFLNVKTAAFVKKIREGLREESVLGIEFEIQAGPRVFVGKVVLEGLFRTKEKVVLRELGRGALQSGEAWSPSAAQKLQERLLETGLFSSVRIEGGAARVSRRFEPGKQEFEIQEKDLKIVVSERNTGSVEFGPGYRSDKGVIGFAEVTYRNLGGWNRRVVLRSQISRKLQNYSFPEQRFTVAYIDPFLADDPARFRLTANYEKSDRRVFGSDNSQVDGYASEESSIGFGVDRDLSARWRWVHNIYTLSQPRIFEVRGRAQSEVYRIGTMGTSFIYDHRDHPFNPKNGFLNQISFEGSSRAFLSDSDAQFFLARNDLFFYVPLGAEATFASSLSLRRLWAIGGTTNIPQSKRLVLGGRSSIRALRETLFSNLGVGDQEAMDARWEYRQPMIGDFSIAYFLDAGRLNALRVESTGWRYGYGVGVRYGTPVGPLSLELALNPEPRDKEEDLIILFSIGAF